MPRTMPHLIGVMPRPAFAEASLQVLLCLATVEVRKCTVYDSRVFIHYAGSLWTNVTDWQQRTPMESGPV
jgi:hypothetical protein